jgi:serpin B
MPKFQIDKTIALEKHLSEKMSLAFSEKADLSGISTREGLKISAVRHQAFINVHEKGTEAGAATAVGLSLKAPPDVEFVADRPFVFLLFDRKDKVVLFAGQLVAPGTGT